MRAENFSTTPHLECTFWGLPKFRPKAFFGQKSGFSPFGQPGAPKRGEYHENFFGPKLFRSPLVFEKKPKSAWIDYWDPNGALEILGHFG